jgi:hypothetical protein
MGDDPPGEWVSVAEAARRLRISPRAVRDRIKHRSLTARPKGNAGREVFLPEASSSRETPGEAAAILPGASGEEGPRPPPEASGAAELLEEMAGLRHALGRAEGELAAELRRSADLAATVGHLRAELAEAVGGAGAVGAQAAVVGEDHAQQGRANHAG